MSKTSMIRVGIAATVAAALLCGTVSPASAQDSGSGGGQSPIGGFGLGDRLEGLIDAQTGDVSLTVPVAGLELSWQSRGAGLDRFALGGGWAIAGLSQLDVRGGVRVFPAAGDVYEADASAPSGLHGYTLGDLSFSQEGGVLPARADGLADERAFAYRLAELGGVVTYFDVSGDPVATVDAHGARRDWVWGDGHRLLKVIGDTGVVTELDWADGSRVVVTTQSGGTAAPAGVRKRSVVSGAVELADDRVASVVDAVGGRTSVTYDADGTVTRLVNASGAETAMTWQRLGDGRTVIQRIAVTEPGTGRELSARTWAPVTSGPTGWPLLGAAVTSSPDAAAGADYTTVLSDGAMRVESTYSASQLMTKRTVSLAGADGDRVVESHSFEYPATAPGADPRQLPPQARQLTGSAVTWHDPAGGERTVSEQYTVDELGRVTERIAADGTTTTTVYDAAVPPGKTSPVGLPLVERAVAADGLVTETRHELNEARTDVIISETYTGRLGDAQLVRTGRTEFEVAADGFVSAERVFPQGGAGQPVVTARSKTLDTMSGTLTVEETVAAGTELAATTSTVTDLVHAQPVEVTDAVDRRSSTEYDGLGRPIEATDGAGNVTATQYLTEQQHGVNATMTTGPDGIARTEEHDPLGRVMRVTDNLDRGIPVDGHERVVETRDYRDARTVAVTDAWGATTVVAHDEFGRPIRAVAPTGLAEVTEYDRVAGTTTRGLTVTEDLADAELVTTEKTDVAGETVATSGRRADGSPVPATERTLDGLGREVAVSDGLTTTKVEFDEFGNPVTTAVASVADGAAAQPLVVGARQFDGFGQSTQKTLVGGEHSRRGTVVERDLLGRTVAEIDQDDEVTRHEYTADGLVSRTTTSEGAVTVNTYDADTRLLTESVVTAPDRPEVRTAYRHDRATGQLLEAYDPADPESTRVVSEYDGFGNVLSVTYPDGKRVSSEYDEHGRKLSTTDVAGRTTTYGYDEAGLLMTAVQTDGGDEIARVGYQYDDLGRVARLDRGNGVTTEMTYTSASEITSEVTTGATGELLAERRYTYSPVGDLHTRVDAVREPGADTLTTTTTAYEYDDLRRLTRSTIHDGHSADAPATRRTDYELTASGDIVRETVTDRPDSPEAVATVRDFSYSPTGELLAVLTTTPDGTATSATQTYDAAGNLTRAVDGTHYRYDAANRQIGEVTAQGDAIETAYWATGDRASLSVTDPVTGASRSTGFYWADGTLVNDTAAAGEQTEHAGSYLLAGAGRHARAVAGEDGSVATSYTTHDRHGNVTELTGAAGSITERYAYTDYGLTEQHTAGAPAAGGERMLRVGDPTYQPFRYAGEYTNPTPARTQHLSIREYDAATMRLTREDPELLHNRYWFADLNPITKIDPSGREPLFDTTANWVFAAVGFAALVIGTASSGAGLAMIAPYISTWAVTGNALLIGLSGLTGLAMVGASAAQIADDLSPDFNLTDEQHAILSLTQIAGAGATALLGLGEFVALSASTRIAGAKIWKQIDDLTPEISSFVSARFLPLNAAEQSQQIRGTLAWLKQDELWGKAWNSYFAKYYELSGDLSSALNTKATQRSFWNGLNIKQGFTKRVNAFEAHVTHLRARATELGTPDDELSALNDVFFTLTERQSVFPRLQNLLPNAQQNVHSATPQNLLGKAL